ncbi:hypothetical protein EJB05_01580 [Eragrostis curvula]|uniref:Uncharacterized protein n=1 Tax=Eragrostis curvula TaxID=38414 RepID=A0A5J9WQI5_9POAL|nr:hypothetical protein EJB05_01580 [Eragrostis curvula]
METVLPEMLISALQKEFGITKKCANNEAKKASCLEQKINLLIQGGSWKNMVTGPRYTQPDGHSCILLSSKFDRSIRNRKHYNMLSRAAMAICYLVTRGFKNNLRSMGSIRSSVRYRK